MPYHYGRQRMRRRGSIPRGYFTRRITGRRARVSYARTRRRGRSSGVTFGRYRYKRKGRKKFTRSKYRKTLVPRSIDPAACHRYRLRVFDNTELTFTNNVAKDTVGAGAIQLHLNSIFDPFAGSAVNQPYGYDELTNRYGKYEVMGCKVTMQYWANPGNTADKLFRLAWFQDTVVEAKYAILSQASGSNAQDTTYRTVCESPIYHFMPGFLLPQNAEQAHSGKYARRWSKYFNLKRINRYQNREQREADMTANPGHISALHVQMIHIGNNYADTNAEKVKLQIWMEFWVCLRELKTLAVT